MKQWERILYILSLLFAVTSLLGELFWASHIRFILDDLFFPFGLIFMGITFLRKKEWRWLILSFVLLSTWGMISDVLANGTLRITPVGMWLRWLKWPIILLTVAQLRDFNFRKESLEKSVIVVFFGLAGLNLLMMLNPFGLGETLSQLYASKPDVLLANYHEFGAFRLSGTVLNPNNNAILFALFMLYFLHVDARKYWKYILLAFILIFLTQSRTTLILMVLILGFYVLRANSRKVNLIVIPAGIITLISGLFVFRSTNLLSIINGSAFQSASWTERMDHYAILFNGSFLQLFLGRGIILDPFTKVGFYFDSTYLSVSYQYGLVGMALWFSTVAAIFVLLRKWDKKSSYGLTLVVFVLGIGMTNFTFLNVECATLLMFLAGAWIFLQGERKLSDQSEKETY